MKKKHKNTKKYLKNISIKNVKSGTIFKQNRLKKKIKKTNISKKLTFS